MNLKNSVPLLAFSIAFVMPLASRWTPRQEPLALPGAWRVIHAENYPSLQAAIDALPERGGMVQLPPGRFEISTPLRVTREDVLLEGSGTATWIRNTSTDGKPALVLEPPSDKDKKTRNWRLTLRGFRLTGNPRSGHGIVANRINELLIDAMDVSHHGGDGIRLDNCYEDPRICDSLITYNKGTGLDLLACHDIVVSANQFEENRTAVRCVDGFNLTMTGNNLDDHTADGVVIENTYGSVVAGNMIEECRGHAIVLDRDCYGIALSANVIAHNVQGGIDLRDAWGLTVSANAFTIMARNALSIGPGSGRVAVTGNSFSDSSIGGGKLKRRPNDRAAAGVLVNGASELDITGNLFSGLRPAGLTVTGKGVRRIVYCGNLMVDAKRRSDAAKEWTEGNLEVDK